MLAVLRGARDLTGRTIEALDAETLELPPPFELLVPLVPPETWAAGVTYERSRDARVDESRVEARDVYSLVYDAERPELFLKDAAGRRTVGPGAAVGVRSDAEWTVSGTGAGTRVGCGRWVARRNDRQRRDRAGHRRCEPPLPSPGKALRGRLRDRPGNCVPDDWWQPFDIELRLMGPDGNVIYEAQTSTARMRRSFEELAAWVVRENPVPAGSVLLTGTGLVPPDDVALVPGQQVEIRSRESASW